MVKKSNELLKPYGLTDAYSYFLMELYQQDGLTQNELHSRIGIEQPTAVRTLERMERDGFITKARNIKDKRAITICLTDKGKECQAIIERCLHQLNKYILNEFTEQQESAVKELLTKINLNLRS